MSLESCWTNETGSRCFWIVYCRRTLCFSLPATTLHYEVYHCVTVYVIVFATHSPISCLRAFCQCLFAPWTDVYEDLQPLFVFTWVLCCLLWISCLAFSIVALANLLLGCHVFCIHLRYSMGTCCSVLPLCLPNFSLPHSFSRKYASLSRSNCVWIVVSLW